ncbi:splicing regulatory glutamine/lysine-rich protein 1-like isoform X2 [Hibiscus syriacus]|uniref:splicing regulatory glutamine/lysine-rich protein 1-like isoform X2 n=1 Tax=Hibiscus syriacus TaxID=106335 RepID=UPI001920A60B|nr:splicing regulatory glutamine/lysine-rich protein 1-like isoform X2 [Hibiscus syriacus]
MSRCFPYPPPGYLKNGIRDEALIESIKIKREEEKAKKERKKEKKDKKEKKREKKERDKAPDIGETKSKKHGHKKRHKDERSQEAQKGGDYQKRRENEVECYEKSTLTEEHGHAVGPQNSSDSTLNSSKRQKLSLSPDSGHNSGRIIRFRLLSQRHKDPEVLPRKEHPCSTSGKIDEAFVQGTQENVPRTGTELEEHPCSTANIELPELNPKLSKEKPLSSSGVSESVARSAQASLPTSLCSSCSPTLALGFKNLVEDWVVPTQQTELTSFVDEDWLFRRKRNLNSGFKSSKDGNIGSSQMKSTSWPHAHFLPETDLYALPFTVPF